MSSTEGRTDDGANVSFERTIMFVATLIVATVLVAFAVYVLGFAVLDSGVSGSGHRTAAAAIHVHS